MQDKKSKSLSYFNNSFNCAQSVVATYGPELGMSEDDCLKIATAFGAGMGKQQHVCGAVTGALMVLSLKFGKALNDPEVNKENTYNKAEEFLKTFESKNGSIHCKQLLQGLDMNNERDLIKIHELGLFETACISYIKQAVDITEQLLNNE